MTGEAATPSSTPSLPQQPGASRPGALCECGCGRHASRRSSYRWYHGHDPAVPAEEKRAALALGGRRGQMTPAEVAQLLTGADLDTREGRQQLRDRLLRLRLAGHVGTAVYNDAMKAVDGAARDVDRQAKPSAAPVVVEVARFTHQANGQEAGS